MANQTPKYRISVISEMLNMHPQTIRTYEKMGLIKPQRSRGNSRLFSDSDLRTIERIQVLTKELGVNLAGVEIILRMRIQIETMQSEAQCIMNSIRSILEKPDRKTKEDVIGVLNQCKTLMVNHDE